MNAELNQEDTLHFALIIHRQLFGGAVILNGTRLTHLRSR